jgi:acyl carrier protein
MPMSNIDHLREILTEMFSLDRVDTLSSDEKDPLGWLGGKSVDRVDFRIFVEERFSVRFPEPLLSGSTLQEMADYIEAAKPTTNPH